MNGKTPPSVRWYDARMLMQSPSAMNTSDSDEGTPVSVKICQRLLAARRRFHANDNIADFIEPGELEVLLDEVETKMKGVLASLVIDTENDHNTDDTARRAVACGLFRFAQPPGNLPQRDDGIGLVNAVDDDLHLGAEGLGLRRRQRDAVETGERIGRDPGLLPLNDVAVVVVVRRLHQLDMELAGCRHAVLPRKKRAGACIQAALTQSRIDTIRLLRPLIGRSGPPPPAGFPMPAR